MGSALCYFFNKNRLLDQISKTYDNILQKSQPFLNGFLRYKMNIVVTKIVLKALCFEMCIVLFVLWH